MAKVNRYSPEVRDRAIRMVVDHRGEYPSQWAAIQSVASKLGLTAETLRRWVRQVEINEGSRAGLSTDEREKLRQLERENKELRRANAILKDASIYVGDRCQVPVSSRRWRSPSKIFCRPICPFSVASSL